MSTETILPIPANKRRAGPGQLHHSTFKTWMIVTLLVLAPLVAYWPTVFHSYGLRDSYSNLREAHEEPGKILQFCASHARPIYGSLLQATYGAANTLEDLQWLRLLSVLLLGGLALLSFFGLRSLGWSNTRSVTFGLWIALVPSGQIIAGWALSWPYVLAAILAFGAFFVAEHAFTLCFDRGPRVVAWAIAALGLLTMSALIYQPSTLFYVVALAAALIERRDCSAKDCLRWVGKHLALAVGALGLAYTTMMFFYAAGVFVKSSRIMFEHHWGTKMMWFIKAPLPNALSLFVINDDNQRDHLVYVASASVVGLILLLGVGAEWRRHGWSRGLIWLAGMVGLPVFAFVVSLVAAERYATYRTIFALTGVVLCFLLASFRSLTGWLGENGRRAIAVLVITGAFFIAHHRAYALIAVPQGNEWRLILAGAERVQLVEPRARVFVIESTPADRSTATIYHDEFGSLSSNSEWVPKEMFKRAMHDLHPTDANLDHRYEFFSGPQLPVGKHFDVIVDLHQLRDLRTEN